MKKLRYLLILFLMFIGINNVCAFDTSLKVYDYAQLLTPTEEANLKKNIDLFIANHNMDMVLVTVKHHDKASTMNYADDFYDYNGFGIGNNYDGVIFVIDFTFWQNGDIWMATTGKAINIYTDARINDILDNVVLKKNNGYYEMFEEFVEVSNYYAKQGIPTYNDISYSDSSVDWKNIIILSLIVPTGTIVILILKNKMVKNSIVASEYLVKDSVVINKRSDRFVTTHTTSVRISDSGSSYSGGGSMSSTHRSSSGRSHGGGGRRL